MRITTVILLVSIMHLSAATHGQRINLKRTNTLLDLVLKDIRSQSGYDIYFDSKVISSAQRVDVFLKDATVEQALETVLKGLNLVYEIDAKNITIKKKTSPNLLEKILSTFIRMEIKGQVINEEGAPMAGATVLLKGTTRVATTSPEGFFRFENAGTNSVLLISFIGYETRELTVASQNADQLKIIMVPSIARLQEIMVNAGYYTVKEKELTGNISKITSADIENQPVTNFLSAISGRAPGVFVQTINGLPGGEIKIQIRGRGSISAGTDPLYVIDGIPFDAVNASASGRMSNGSITGLTSPLGTLNPADIESVSILKDADATSIYGSRGSNGVVLITTKKGKPGKAEFTLSLQQGVSKAASLPKLSSLKEYLAIRREAYTNDGVVPSADPASIYYAPELFAWDTTKVMNWAEYSLGHSAKVSDIQIGLSGGSLKTIFNISANFRTENTIISKDSRYNRGGLHFNLGHTSTDGRFNLDLNSSLSVDNSRMPNPQGGLTSALLLPPHFPAYDINGNYNWDLFTNPLALEKTLQKSSSANILTSLNLRYKLYNELSLRINAGYNRISMSQVQIFPSASLYPIFPNYSSFGNNYSQTFITEPQVDFIKDIGKSKITALVGATFQSRLQKADEISVQNFSNAALMENISAAGNVDYLSNNVVEYRQLSVFARLNYALMGKYIVNATLRRDGSSRFGPGNQFGNFGSLGFAWLFSKEKGFDDILGFVSTGKLRGSFGITGNDQISDYAFLSTYFSPGVSYNGISTLIPQRISNADFHWENTRKFEIAADLGFWKDRILLSASYYINRSRDQLVNYTIPGTTGFASYQANLPAIVQNTGLELEINSRNISTKNLTWNSSFNLTLPRNKLLKFDNLSASSYNRTLEVGYDISRISGRIFTGVDPQTGNPMYAGQNGVGTNEPYDFFTIGKTSPMFYGGMGNQVSYKRWTLDIFTQFAKQTQLGGVSALPGGLYNSYAIQNQRWQKPGDQTSIPRATILGDFYYAFSSAGYYNVPYLRVKNISLSYVFSFGQSNAPSSLRLRVYAEAQNLITIWDKDLPMLDPETGGRSSVSNNAISPLKTAIIGLKLNM